MNESIKIWNVALTSYEKLVPKFISFYFLVSTVGPLFCSFSEALVMLQEKRVTWGSEVPDSDEICHPLAHLY